MFTAMFTTLITVYLLITTSLSQTTIWATPHDSYSSAIGVLGCKVDTNRIAYWPMAVDCSRLCVQVSYASRSVYLLRIDQSGGAYDMSYDAWNYLVTGFSATDKPSAGGATEMTYTEVDIDKCASMISTKGRALPLSAANSMNFLSSCLANSSSWVAQNYALFNIVDSVCSLGFDEQCSLDLEKSNQPFCKHTLGLANALTSDPVYNIQYPSGKKVLASTVGSGASVSTSDAKFSGLDSRSFFIPILVLFMSLTYCI